MVTISIAGLWNWKSRNFAKKTNIHSKISGLISTPKSSVDFGSTRSCPCSSCSHLRYYITQFNLWYYYITHWLPYSYNNYTIHITKHDRLYRPYIFRLTVACLRTPLCPCYTFFTEPPLSRYATTEPPSLTWQLSIICTVIYILLSTIVFIALY